jgi:hypothetical protein
MTARETGAVERFFIEHGMIHDRVTGKHVTTEPIEFEEGKWDTSPLDDACALLNQLARPQPTPSATGEIVEPVWREGSPPHPWDKEWFIAKTTFDDRVVLKALPEEYTYDFKTADDTYIKRDCITQWMQFPDSQYISPDAARSRKQAATIAELRSGLENIAGHDAAANGLSGFAFELVEQLTCTARATLERTRAQ